MATRRVLFLSLFCWYCCVDSAIPYEQSLNAERQPNIVLILTDDQDLYLGGMDPIPRTRELLQARGATFQNFFVTTPVCCPSRAALLSGRYGHNTVSASPDACMHQDVSSPSFANFTIAAMMSSLGYTTGHFGKLYNSVNFYCGENITRIPPGWDRFFSLCDMGGYFSNTYNDDGTLVSYGSDIYMTSTIGNMTIQWLENVTKQDSPFFAYVCPHAPHIADSVYPYITTAAPWYNGTYDNASAPRTPNYNEVNSLAHTLVREQPLMDLTTITWTDTLFQKRWESLISVDDMVEAIVDTLVESGVINNTYIIFTSDHGYNLGQFRLPSGKFNLYENDIRVPFIITGPGIVPNSKILEPCGNVDISPTIYDLGGGILPVSNFDGRSLKPLFTNNDVLLNSGSENYIGLQEQPRGVPATTWRDALLIEYWELGTVLRGAPTSPECNPNEGACAEGCPCLLHEEDGSNNTYIGIRLMNETFNLVYTEFYISKIQRSFDGYTPIWYELYNLTTDPWQMTNLFYQYNETNPLLIDDLQNRLHSQYGCQGTQCE